MIQLRAQASGRELVPLPAKSIEANTTYATLAMKGQMGALPWPALLRKLDRVDPSYRT
jgi:hypothetical protein